jgi:hypothetical protein
LDKDKARLLQKYDMVYNMILGNMHMLDSDTLKGISGDTYPLKSKEEIEVIFESLPDLVKKLNQLWELYKQEYYVKETGD